MNKENRDPDYVFFDRDKSHNTSHYKKVPGVCTNSKMELNRILRTTASPPMPAPPLPLSNNNNIAPKTSLDRYWIDPSDVLGGRKSDHALSRPGGRRRESTLDLFESDEAADNVIGMGVNLLDMGQGEAAHNLLEMGEVESARDLFGLRDVEAAHNLFEMGDVEGMMEGEATHSLSGIGAGDVVVEEGGVKVPKRKRKHRGRKLRGKKKKVGNLSKYSQREVEREIERNSKRFNEKIRIESLKKTLGDPWDGISFDDKKHFALHFFYAHLQVT